MTTSPFAEHTARLARQLINALVSESDDERLAERTRAIARELATAAGQPGSVTVPDPHVSTARIEGDLTPASSARNPIAPPMSITRDGTESRCDLTMPLQYQGPPGRVHGGVVALLLDHVLGNAANAGAGPRSFTRYLNVSYEAATPIGEPLSSGEWAGRTGASSSCVARSSAAARSAPSVRGCGSSPGTSGPRRRVISRVDNNHQRSTRIVMSINPVRERWSSMGDRVTHLVRGDVAW